jgi:hypothetical protein
VLYQTLGRYQQIAFTTINAFTLNGIEGVSLLSVTPNESFQHNDLVSTIGSTHCARCGFTPLATLRLNHSLLKCREVMNHIVDVILFLYPIEAEAQ